MSGSTINNWGKFNQNVFKGISGMGGEEIAKLQRSKNEGVLASRVAEVKESHVHASTVKKFFLGLITFGIYNICHGISAKNQRATQAALKQGVDNVHGALSYLSMMAQRDVQRRGAGGNMNNFGMGYAAEVPKIKSYNDEDERFLQAANCVVKENGEDGTFKGGEFLRTTMGGVTVDIGLVAPQSAAVRIKDGNGKGKDAVVTLPNIEDALFKLEKDIVRDTELFGGKMIDKLLTRYDRRLECEKTVNGANSVGAPIRNSIKTRQHELSRDILSVRFGMSAEKIDYLDRDLAKQLAAQAVKDNVASGPALDALYDKITSQKHLVDVDMLSLYRSLDAVPPAERKVHLPEPKPPFDPGAGRPTEAQRAIHDLAADLVLAEDISDYDYDVGKSGYLDGLRLRNVFDKHKGTLASLLEARAADGNAAPAALASLDPGMRTAMVRLLDALLEQKVKENGAKGGDPLTPEEFIDRLVTNVDKDLERERKAKAEGEQGGLLLEVDDLSKEMQVKKLGIGTDTRDEFTIKKEYRKLHPNDDEDEVDFKTEPQVDAMKEADKATAHRRHGKANFFAQLELEFGKSVDEAMRETVQTQVKDMIKDVFPKSDPNALDANASLDKIVGDKGSDPQVTLLRKTLEVYFEKMGAMDKRNMMARLVRNTVDGASQGLRFGELLKGAGPIMQKMMQSLDPDAFTDPNFRLAIEDMRSRLAPIPEKAVKAQLSELIAKSKGAIESITVTRPLGAASVGQTFLCSIKLADEAEPRECVIKMLRPDAHMRALREAEVFREVAKDIEGMPLTFEGKLEGIMKELDLRIEAENVRTGLNVYDAGTHKVNKTFNNVNSMRLSEIPGARPTRTLMVLERAPGVPMDKFIDDAAALVETVKTSTVDAIGNRPAEDAVVAMLDGAEELTKTYDDALAKHDGLTNMTTVWIREGLFTKTGFYHGDLHAGNIMVPTAQDLRKGVPNGVTMIDFGNATKLTPEEQKNVIRVIAGAAGNDPGLFLKGLETLLSPEGKATLAAKRDEVTDIVTSVLGKGTGNDAGLRMTAVFKLLQTKFSINVPPVISNFQSSQERLSVAMESMLRTMTNAEVARLDVILAAARKDGFDVGEIGGGDMTPAQVFAQKKDKALAYINEKLEQELTEDVREKLEALKAKLDEADNHRPMSMMQCMVAVIKQNLLSALRALGAGSSRTVTENLTNDGVINADNNPAAAPKERRYVEIWP